MSNRDMWDEIPSWKTHDMTTGKRLATPEEINAALRRVARIAPTPTPPQPNKVTVDSILLGVWHSGYNRHVLEIDSKDKGFDRFSFSLSDKEAKLQLQQLVSEVIGEDEPHTKYMKGRSSIVDVTELRNWAKVISTWRNKLRSEQRTRAKKRGLL